MSAGFKLNPPPVYDAHYFAVQDDNGDSPQLPLLDAAEELAAAQASPDGTWLSPEAQSLYEKEGAARFAKYHPATRRNPLP